MEVLSGYMIGTAVISLFGAVTSALIMIILGLPLAIPIGVLTFFGGFIPYIGSFVTTALAFLVAVAVGTTADIVIMFVYTIVFNLIQGSVVAPIVYSKALSLHPAIVLLAVPIGGAVAGHPRACSSWCRSRRSCPRRGAWWSPRSRTTRPRPRSADVGGAARRPIGRRRDRPPVPSAAPAGT